MVANISGGLWWAERVLSQNPWHHMMLAWVAGAFAAGYGALGLYKEVRNRLIVREWLTRPDADGGSEPEALREALRALPARHRAQIVDARARRRAGARSEATTVVPASS